MVESLLLIYFFCFDFRNTLVTKRKPLYHSRPTSIL